MQAKNVLIAANGTWPNQAIWKPLVDCSDIVIACDGAIVQLLQNDIIPDFIVGDLDSIPQEMSISQLEQLGIAIIPILDQESNDLAKAIDYCNNLGATKIDVIGIEGGRLDHQIGAYFSLCEQESNAILHLDNWTARLVPSEGLVLNSIEKGKNISLFAIGTVKGVALSGVKWTLNNEELLPGTNGLHNESIGGEIKISHLEGHLLILIER
ncbi:thiamine diphosphokinase [Candidatus Poseidoniaceae archaeon]|nr:thiamine diphosphokinase [Candidatus Poseidoniaceae archaeon]